MSTTSLRASVALLLAGCAGASSMFAADAEATAAPAAIFPVTTPLSADETARTENAPVPRKRVRREKLPAHTRPETTGRGKPVVVHSALQDGVYGPEFVQRGMSAANVETLLGPAPVRATPDLWIYWDYRVAGATGVAPEHDTLIVLLQNGVVIELRLADSASVRGLLARMKPSGS